MKYIKKIGVIVIMILIGALAYFGIQRYQSHHENNVKIQLQMASSPKQLINMAARNAVKCKKNGGHVVLDTNPQPNTYDKMVCEANPSIQPGAVAMPG